MAIPIKLYKSSEQDSSGGSITAEEVNVKTLFPTVRPSDIPSTANSCIPGVMTRKIFMTNEGIEDVLVEITLAYPLEFVPENKYQYGIVSSDAPVGLFDDYKQTLVIPIPTGTSVPLWIYFGWPVNSGEDAFVGFNMNVIVSGANTNIGITYKVRHKIDPYVELPGQSENDYSSKIKDLFICFLRSALYRFYRPDIRWNPIEAYTNIFIADRLTYNITEPDFRPSLIVVRGDLRWRDMTINQRLFADMLTGKETFTDLIMFNVMIQCIAREGVHAEFLGITVFKMLKFYKEALKKAGLHDLMSISIGQEVSILGDTRPEAVMVPISITGCIQDKWSVTPVVPEFNGGNILIDASKGLTRTIIVE